jgi:protein phosphatase 2C family protein 2/3
VYLSGIWDCLSSQQVVDFIRRALANGDALTKICEDLMVKCLAPDSELGGIGCDNMTVVIVALLNGRTLEEWQEWVKKRVDTKGTAALQTYISHVNAYLAIGYSRL